VPELTPFQTIGPFFHFALPYRGGETLAEDATPGEHIVIEGTVRDGAGAPVPEALVEIWQADASGRYHHPDDDRHLSPDDAFDGFGRTPTDAHGHYRFTTVKPGRVPAPDGGLQARHVLFGILGRGILTRFVTRMYFEDDESLADDPVLARVPLPRRSTLVARLAAEGRYRFDIVLQGVNETVFFDV
jgi:protocatechuate 3,4-dioxygenase alpha subunit